MSELALKLIAENKARYEVKWKQIPEFGRLQGVPAKPFSSYTPHDDGGGEVFAGMEGAVRRVREKNVVCNNPQFLTGKYLLSLFLS